MNSLRLSSDVFPILLANVLINLDGRAPTIQRIATSPLRAGNPIILARLDAVVVGLETCTFEALESLTTVIECAPGLGQRHAPNPRVTRQSAGLALDIHDASGLRLCLSSRRLSKAAAFGRVGNRNLQVCCLSAR